MRILLVATISETLSGFFLPFARHFRQRGWTVGAAATGVEKCLRCRAEFDDVWDVDWSRNPLDPRNLTKAPRRIREIAAAGNYDVVHVNTPVAAFVTRFALRKRDSAHRPALIYTAHGFHFHENGSTLRNAAFLSIERMAAAWTDYLVVMNTFDRRMAERYQMAAQDHLMSIPGVGVDRTHYRRESLPAGTAARVRRELGLEGVPMFLMIGEFIPRKRQADAITALGRLRDTSACLVMAGQGPTLESSRNLAAQLGLGKRVHFLGVRRDVPALLLTCDAVLLPSDHEGLPRSILEAMSMGVPAVGSDIRGTRELLGSGAGLLVPTGNVDVLAQAMQRLIDHPEEARAMGEAGKQQSAAYDLERVLGMYEDLYRRAAKNKNLEEALCMQSR